MESEDFDEYFQYLTKQIVKLLCNEDLNPEDLTKNPDDLNVILFRLKNLMSDMEMTDKDVFKYVSRFLIDDFDESKKLPSCSQSEPDINQFYRTLEAVEAHEYYSRYFKFPHNRNQFNVPKSWSSPKLLEPRHSLFAQIDKIAPKKMITVPVNLEKEKSIVSLAVGDHLFSDQLPKGIIEQFTVFRKEDLIFLMTAPKIFAEKLLAIILKKISVKDSVRRYTVDLLMSCLYFGRIHNYNEAQVAISLTAFLIAHYHFINHRYDDYGDIFEAFFINFAYMNFQAEKVYHRAFNFPQTRDLIHCFIKLYIQQLPLISSLLHETKGLLIADLETNKEAKKTLQAVEASKADRDNTKWNLLYHLPTILNFDPNRFAKFKKNIKRIKLEQEIKRHDYLEPTQKCRSKPNLDLRKMEKKNYEYFILVFCAFINNVEFLNNVKFEPLYRYQKSDLISKDDTSSIVSCAKVCEHYPYYYQRLITKLLKKFKLLGSEVDEENLSEEEQVEDDLFTLIQDPPTYDNILQNGFFDPKKKTINYLNLYNLTLLLEEIHSNKYICPEKKLEVYENLKSHFHNFQERHRYVLSTVFCEPINFELLDFEAISPEWEEDFFMKNFYNYFTGYESEDDLFTDYFTMNDLLNYPNFLVEQLIIENNLKICNHYLDTSFDNIRNVMIKRKRQRLRFRKQEYSSDECVEKQLNKFKILLSNKDKIDVFKLNMLYNMYNTLNEHKYFDSKDIERMQSVQPDIEEYIEQFNSKLNIRPDRDNLELFEEFLELDELNEPELENCEELLVDELCEEELSEPELENCEELPEEEFCQEESSRQDVDVVQLLLMEVLANIYHPKKEISQFVILERPETELYSYRHPQELWHYKEKSKLHELSHRTVYSQADDSDIYEKADDSHFYEHKSCEKESKRLRNNEFFQDEYLSKDPSNKDYFFKKIPKRELEEDYTNNVITWIFVDVERNPATLFKRKLSKKTRKLMRKNKKHKDVRFCEKQNLINKRCSQTDTDPTNMKATKEDYNLIEYLGLPKELPDKFYLALQAYGIAKLKDKVIRQLLQAPKEYGPLERTRSLPTVCYRFNAKSVRLPVRSYSLETFILPKITMKGQLNKYRLKKESSSKTVFEKSYFRLKELIEVTGNEYSNSSIEEAKPNTENDSWSKMNFKLKKQLLFDEILVRDENLFKIKNFKTFLQHINFDKTNLDYKEFWENYRKNYDSNFVEIQKIAKKQTIQRKPLYYTKSADKLIEKSDVLKKKLEALKMKLGKPLCEKVDKKMLLKRKENYEINFELNDAILEKKFKDLFNQNKEAASITPLKSLKVTHLTPPVVNKQKFYEQEIDKKILKTLSNESIGEIKKDHLSESKVEKALDSYTRNILNPKPEKNIFKKSKRFNKFYQTLKSSVVKMKLKTEIQQRYENIKKILREYVNNIIKTYEKKLMNPLLNIRDISVLNKSMEKFNLPMKRIKDVKSRIIAELSKLDKKKKDIIEKSIKVNIESKMKDLEMKPLKRTRRKLQKIALKLNPSKSKLLKSETNTLSLMNLEREPSTSNFRQVNFRSGCKPHLSAESGLFSEPYHGLKCDEVAQMFGYRTTMSPEKVLWGDVLLSPALVNVIKKGYQVDIDLAEEGLPAKCFQKGNQMLAYDLQNMDRYGAYRSKRYLLIPIQQGNQNMLILQMYPSWMKYVRECKRTHKVPESKVVVAIKPPKLSDSQDSLPELNSYVTLHMAEALREQNEDLMVKRVKASFNLYEGYPEIPEDLDSRYYWENDPLDRLLQKIEFKNVKEKWIRELKRNIVKQYILNKPDSWKIEFDEESDIDLYKVFSQPKFFPTKDVDVMSSDIHKKKRNKKYKRAKRPITRATGKDDTSSTASSSVFYWLENREFSDERRPIETSDKNNGIMKKKSKEMKEADFRLILEGLHYFKHRSKFLPFNRLKKLDIENGEGNLETVIKDKKKFEHFIRNIAKTFKIPGFLDKWKTNRFEKFGPVYKYDILTKELRQRYKSEEIDLEGFDNFKTEYSNVNDLFKIFFFIVSSDSEDSERENKHNCVRRSHNSKLETKLECEFDIIKYIDAIDEKLIDEFYELNYDDYLWEEVIYKYLKIKEELKENLNKTQLSPCEELKLWKIYERYSRRTSTIQNRDEPSEHTCVELWKTKNNRMKCETDKRKKLSMDIFRKSSIFTKFQEIIKTRTTMKEDHLQVKSKECISHTAKTAEPKSFIKQSKPITTRKTQKKESLAAKHPLMKKRRLYRQNLLQLITQHDQLYQTLTIENQKLRGLTHSIFEDKNDTQKVQIQSTKPE